MANLTRGYSFDAGERLTPSKLNQLVSNAGITGVSASDLAVDGYSYFYGSTTPPASCGTVWYDTTPGAEGLRAYFCSPSNASVSKFVYMLPRREMIGWVYTSVSVGTPLFIGTRALDDANHRRWENYDGGFFLKLWPYEGNAGVSGPHIAMAIAMEASASGPILAAWAGLVPGAFATASPVTNGDPFAIYPDNDARHFRSVTANRQYIVGTILGDHAAPGVTEPPHSILWGTGPDKQDIVG